MKFRYQRKIALSFVIVFLLATLLSTFNVFAEDESFSHTDDSYSVAMSSFSELLPPTPAAENVGAVYLYNIENTFVIHEEKGDEVIYPASTVKIMTGYIACELLADRLGEVVTITSSMLAGSYGRSMKLVEGEEIYIQDLLFGAICGGYNDAATAVAAICDGSSAAFVERMNKTAEDIGMPSTNYTNPTGLHEDAMVTSARDTAILAREAYKNSLYMEICSAKEYTVPATNKSDSRYFTSRNFLISGTNQSYYNGYCRGMNAGATDEGGYCAVTVWEKGGASNVCVVMGGSEVPEKGINYTYRYANSLLSWVNSNFSYRKVYAGGDVLDNQAVSMTGVSKSESKMLAGEDLLAYMPRSLDTAMLTTACHYDSTPLVAPIAQGEAVGKVTVSYGGCVLGSVRIVAGTEFAENGFLVFMSAFGNYLYSRAFIATLVCFIILIVIYIRRVTVNGKRFSANKPTRQVRRRKRRIF